MSIDSNDCYLFAFKQCKLQLRPHLYGTALRVAEVIRVIYRKNRRIVIPLLSLKIIL